MHYKKRKPISEADQQANKAKFMSENGKMVEMLDEMQERNPWLRSLIGSFWTSIEYSGKLSDKQKSYVTSLYLDNCIRSDADIARQIEIRKLTLRLVECVSGKITSFVWSVKNHTDNHPFTLRQMSAIEKIAKNVRIKLLSVPELTDKNFDGWFMKNDAEK